MLPGDADRIDFISAYCDRWCERCAYTARCSAYASDVAAGMCGDPAEGLELALGRPRLVVAPPPIGFEADDEFEDDLLETAEELAEADRILEDSDRRVAASPITALSFEYAAGACEWLRAHGAALRNQADPVLGEALTIVAYDAAFIGAKLQRALSGRDHARHLDDDEDRIQNDWNGSAKVALISLERSEAAWRTIAQADGDERPSLLAARANELRRQVLDEFPDAPAFVRPGFDEPWR